MKKKFLHFKLLGVFVLALSLSLVGCKDYDDDIDNLQGQITELTSSLNTKINTVETAITTLQNKDTELKNDIATLKTQVDNAATETARLHAEALAAVATAKAEAIAAAKADLEVVKADLQGQINLLKTDLAGHETRISKTEGDIALLVGRLNAIDDTLVELSNLKTTVSTLQTDFALALVEYGEYKEAIEIQLLALDEYAKATNKNVEDVKKELENALERIVALENNLNDVTATVETLAGIDFDALQALVNTINSGLNTMQSNVNGMITSVRLVSTDYNGEYRSYFSLDDNNGSNMNFNIVKAIVDTDFGLTRGYNESSKVGFSSITTPYENGFAFSTGAEIKALSKVLIQVTPVNASMPSLDNISLINTKGETTVNNLLKAVKIEKFNELLTTSITRGLPEQTGLYEVTFELIDSKEASHKNVTFVGTSPSSADAENVLFAIAIENKLGETNADRHVMSTFGVTASIANREIIYDLSFNVDNEWVGDLANRFYTNSTTTGYTGLLDYKWIDNATNYTNPAATGQIELDLNDLRSFKNYFYVDVNTKFKITFPGDKPYAYYVVLDKGGLGLGEDEYISERNAWNLYSFTGLRKVVYGDQPLELSINSEDAKGDIIGFRVIAVNADGTLVDPDGKAFYVYCGKAEDSASLEFNMIFSDGTYSFNLETNDYAASSNIVRSELDLKIMGRSVDESEMLFYNARGVVVSTPLGNGNWSNWSSVRFISLKNSIQPTELEDGKIYTGYIVNYIAVGDNNGQQVAVSRIPVTVKKTLPTTFGANLAFKSAQGSPIKLYPTPENGVAAYYFKNAFNYIVNSTAQNELLADIQFGFVPFSTDVQGINFVQSVPQHVTVDPALVGVDKGETLKYYDMNAYYHYGNISTDSSKNPYIVAWTPFKAAFCSYMQESTYSWRTAQSITFNSATAPTITLSNINVTPPYGATFNNLGWTGNVPNSTNGDKRYKNIIKGIMDIGGVRDEYFSITVNQASSSLVFEKNPDNSQTGPTTDLSNVKIILVIVDDFDREIEVTVTGSFTLKKGS